MGKELTCSLALLAWTCLESEGRKEVIPICLKHPASKVKFGPFGTGIIVTCDAGNHLIKLCDRKQFEAERQEAGSRL